MSLRLEELGPCFQGVLPSTIATCDAAGEPNVTYLSQVFYLDPRHVALSCQFFNKTHRNVRENPQATVVVLHPITFDAYRLELRFDHAETEGALFDRMALRIQAIASHTGMTGVFKLRSADVYEVLRVEKVAGFQQADGSDADAPAVTAHGGHMTELRALQVVSDRINRAADLDELLSGALAAMEEVFGFAHAMVLVPESEGRLVSVASRGYGEAGIGAEVRVGEGLLGTVAAERRAIRVAGLGRELRYGRAIRDRATACGAAVGVAPEIPLPGLPDAQAQLALPLLACERLVGVLAIESADPMAFDEWDESFLHVIANQLALGIDRAAAAAEEPDAGPSRRARPPRAVRPAPSAARAPHTFTYFRNDDCVFVDGEYLIRNVPGKILWKVLNLHEREGRTEFTNRELRLDPSLGMPAVKDNLESRLILLRKRLAQKCPGARLVPVRRGRFALELDGPVRLVEKECG